MKTLRFGGDSDRVLSLSSYLRNSSIFFFVKKGLQSLDILGFLEGKGMRKWGIKKC